MNESTVNIRELAFRLRAMAVERTQSILDEFYGKDEEAVGPVRDEVDTLLKASSMLDENASDLRALEEVKSGGVCKHLTGRYVLYSKRYYDENRWDHPTALTDTVDELTNTVYNLRLYLTKVKEYCESTGSGLWGEMSETFDGLPGFVEVSIHDE